QLAQIVQERLRCATHLLFRRVLPKPWLQGFRAVALRGHRGARLGRSSARRRIRPRGLSRNRNRHLRKQDLARKPRRPLRGRYPTATLAPLVADGRLRATGFSVARELDTINICVPAPLRKTKDPDMSD